MATYGVINTSNCKFTKDGNIVSGKYYVSSTATAIENGNLVVVGEVLSASNREVMKLTAPAAVTDLAIGVVCTPELIYDESTSTGLVLDQFRNAAGAISTVGMLAAGDYIELTDECIISINDDNDVPTIGNYVTITQSSTKWTEKASLGGTESVYGIVRARYLYKTGAYMNTVQVIKAN